MASTQLRTYNPYSHQQLETFTYIDDEAVEISIKNAHSAYQSYQSMGIEKRQEILYSFSKIWLDEADALANTCTISMGKPISQAKAEVEKCAWLCRYYAENGAKFIKPTVVSTDANQSEVHYEAMGVVLAIMPWNYPYWQVMRCLAPAILLGNAVLLKHADNVLPCAQYLQKLAAKSGLPEGFFQHLIIQESQVEKLIASPLVVGVSLTGSTRAGSAVASLAGKYIKKSVLELGGSNALVVLEDASLEKTVDTCLQARFQNTGQSCIAGKRLLVHEKIYDAFIELLTEKVRLLKAGNPLKQDTYIGVLAREDLAEQLEKQLQASVSLGASIRCGGQRNKTFFEPTLVENVTPEMPLFKEETFGPVLAITKFSTLDEAVALANHTKYGLGVSVFSDNIEKAKTLIPLFKDGAVFINSLVKSHPALPFGGVGQSGYGRELGKEGVLEFANIKTVYIQE